MFEIATFFSCTPFLELTIKQWLFLTAKWWWLHNLWRCVHLSTVLEPTPILRPPGTRCTPPTLSILSLKFPRLLLNCFELMVKTYMVLLCLLTMKLHLTKVTSPQWLFYCSLSMVIAVMAIFCHFFVNILGYGIRIEFLLVTL